MQNIMPLKLKEGESLKLEASARYQAMEGSIALTDKRLVFYCIEKEMFKGMQYSVVFDVPLVHITNATSRGEGMSILKVDVDTSRVTGDPRHEFFLVGGIRWADAIKTAVRAEKVRQKRSVQNTQPNAPAAPGKPGLSPWQSQPGAAAQKKLSKVCLNCMSVVPEDIRLCPRCGLYVQ